MLHGRKNRSDHKLVDHGADWLKDRLIMGLRMSKLSSAK